MLLCIDISQVKMVPRKLAGRCFLKEVINAVLNKDTGDFLEYCHLTGNPKYRKIWGKSYGNDFRRLAQGTPGRVEGTDTLFFVDKEDLPTARYRDIMYGRIVVSYRPKKQDPNQV